MKKSKHAEWLENITSIKFRTEKKMLEFLGNSELHWRKRNDFSPEELFTLGYENLDEAFVYENQNGEFIDPDVQVLYRISVSDYLENCCILDSDEYPILSEYLKEYLFNPQRLDKFYADLKIKYNVKGKNYKECISELNSLILSAVENDIKPFFYFESGYAELLVLIGGVLKEHKNKCLEWSMNHLVIKDEYSPCYLRPSYFPSLIGTKGEVFDIINSFRQVVIYKSSVFDNYGTRVVNYAIKNAELKN